MNEPKLRRLLHQYFNNTISRADCIELLNYLGENSEEVAGILNSGSFHHDVGPGFSGIQAQQVFQRIKSDPRYTTPNRGPSLITIPFINKQRIAKLYRGQWFKVAAILLICCTAVALFKDFYGKQKIKKYFAVNRPEVYIMPGGKKATLTSGNKVIVLDNTPNGLLAKAGRLDISKSNNELVYSKNPQSAGASNEAAQPVMNTLATPKGGEYQVVLSDGSRVWLNSLSSISYPAEFTGTERHVKLTGEAYFEVAKNKDKPFFVSINNVEVKVLGTHFNIAAYDNDDDITTTLLEGSVQMKKNGSMILLKPGQQGVVKNNSNNIMVSSANIDEAMAWKNGYFIFNDEDIAGIMKKVSRWYDIDVVYNGNFNDQEFGGTFYRSKSINELLHHLEKLGNIHFNIEGRRIIVMK